MIGISSPPMCMMDFDDAAELVRPHFGLWEIVSEANHFLPDIETEIREFLETTVMKMSVHAPFSDINLAAFDQRTRKYSISVICEIIRISNRLGIGPVTLHPGVVGPIQRYDRGKVFRLTRESLESIDAEARDCSASVALENMPVMKGTICQTADEVESIIEGLEIGICMDIGHANISGQVGEMLRLVDRFVNIHVHDNVGGPSDQHLALGMGNIDFGVLRGLQYYGNHIIEVKNTDMVEACASKKYLEKVLG